MTDRDMRGYLDELVARYPDLAEQDGQIAAAFELMREAVSAGGKIIACGNGGSAADAQHMVGELMKRFEVSRPIDADLASRLCAVDPDLGGELAAGLEGTIPALALTGQDSLTTAVANDGAPGSADYAFAQQVAGLGREGDVLVAISTSGNSRNVLLAAVCARALGMKVVGLAGARGGRLAELADACVRVPRERVADVQELHLPVYHCWCRMLEASLF